MYGCPEFIVDFPSERKVTATLVTSSIEESFLENQFENMNDGLHLINDLAIPPSSISGKMS